MRDNPYDFVYPIGPELIRLAILYAEQEKEPPEDSRLAETRQELLYAITRVPF